ncbi:MAG: fructosamine kinase family protein [Chloroflexota bacterium]
MACTTLTHEDLNPNNVLLTRDRSGWCLGGILDFDSAWAGCPESDLARLELWRGMTHPAFWDGYTTVVSIDDGYPARRPIFQLLWCLEYARPTRIHVADTARVCRALGVEAPAFP